MPPSLSDRGRGRDLPLAARSASEGSKGSLRPALGAPLYVDEPVSAGKLLKEDEASCLSLSQPQGALGEQTAKSQGREGNATLGWYCW